LCDRETLLKERELKLQLAEEKRRKAEELKREQERKQAEKEAKKAMPPNEMFLKEIDKYSKFDEQGIPTHDLEGKEVSKSARKKLEKAHEQQKKSYEEFLASKKVNEN
jgi:cysteinyl-tRNA synthetase